MASYTADEIDAILDRIESAVQGVIEAKGSIVKLPKAELELLAHFEEARDFMMSVLKRNDKDREVLHSIFGDDCSRIARIRAALEGLPLADLSAGDQRRQECISACESVEKVMQDSGLATRLREVQAKAKVDFARRRQTIEAQLAHFEQALASSGGISLQASTNEPTQPPRHRRAPRMETFIGSVHTPALVSAAVQDGEESEEANTAELLSQRRPRVETFLGSVPEPIRARPQGGSAEPLDPTIRGFLF